MPIKNKTSLDSFFNPQSVAIIGASAKPGKVGNDIVVNLKNSFGGKIYPINLDDKDIEGLPAYPSILQVPRAVDLAIIVIPAQFVPKAVEQCGKKKCTNIVIISAGFRELGPVGMKLEKQVEKIAQKYQIRILGPNCLGYISNLLPINASFAKTAPAVGKIAFLSQSGALGTAVLDLAQAQKLGLAYFVSLGNKLDIDESEVLEYLMTDKKVKVAMAYLEDVRNGTRFMEIASALSRKKPLVVLKAGKTEHGQQAVSSHTGSLAGSAQTYRTVFNQVGAIEAEDLEDFVNLAKGFSLQPLPRGNRVAIITNAGGPGVLLTDLLPANGLTLASLSVTSQKKLKAGLPEAASVKNPIDVLGDATADRYQLALEQALKDDKIDAIIIALTPQKMTDIAAITKTVGQISRRSQKTVLACFMGEASITPHYELFSRYSLPVYAFPNQAVATLGQMWRYNQWKKNNLKTKPTIKPLTSSKTPKILNKKTLTEIEVRQLLKPWGFNFHRAVFARHLAEAEAAAQNIGWPIAVKVVSPKALHKSDVGGVKLNIKSVIELERAVKQMKKNIPAVSGFLIGEMVTGFEIIVGMKRDRQFGPLVMVGTGGIYAEVFNDVSFRIAPFGPAVAREMIKELKVAKILAGARGQKPLDIEALADILVRLGKAACQLPRITEVDFNPVMVGAKGQGAKIVDARIISQ